MIKKSLCLFLCLFLSVLMFTACGKNESDKANNTDGIDPVLSENINTSVDLLEIKAADGYTLATLTEKEPIENFVNSLDLASWQALDTPEDNMRPSYTYVLSQGNTSVTLTAYIAHNCAALNLPQETWYFTIPEDVVSYLNDPQI